MSAHICIIDIEIPKICIFWAIFTDFYMDITEAACLTVCSMSLLQKAENQLLWRLLTVEMTLLQNILQV